MFTTPPVLLRPEGQGSRLALTQPLPLPNSGTHSTHTHALTVTTRKCWPRDHAPLPDEGPPKRNTVAMNPKTCQVLELPHACTRGMHASSSSHKEKRTHAAERLHTCTTELICARATHSYEARSPPKAPTSQEKESCQHAHCKTVSPYLQHGSTAAPAAAAVCAATHTKAAQSAIWPHGVAYLACHLHPHPHPHFCVEFI